jgi:hypothetical protein
VNYKSTRAFSIPIESGRRALVSCFDAFSSREPVPTPHPVRGTLSLENALADMLPDIGDQTRIEETNTASALESRHRVGAAYVLAVAGYSHPQ